MLYSGDASPKAGFAERDDTCVVALVRGSFPLQLQFVIMFGMTYRAAYGGGIVGKDGLIMDCGFGGLFLEVGVELVGALAIRSALLFGVVACSFMPYHQ